MKKFFILIILIFAIIPVFAEEIEQNKIETIVPPKWTDFCETGYENAVYKNKDDFFNIFNYVKTERTKTNYWAERRTSFEKYLKTCNALEGEAQAACYTELRKSENEKNDLYKLKRDQLLYENNIQLNRR